MSFLDQEIQMRLMTPQEVMNVFVEYRRAQIEICEAVPDSLPTTDTTIEEWMNASLDEFGYNWVRGIGHFLNNFFNLQLPTDEWRPVLSPSKVRTMGLLCDFISAKSIIPDVQPMHILGGRCRPAGAFLAVRNLIRKRGVNISDLSPSTPLEQYAQQGFPQTWNELVRAEPRLINRMRLHYRRDFPYLLFATALFLNAIILATIGLADRGIILFLSSILTILLVHILHNNSVKRQEAPKSVEFKKLKTFRDLSLAIGSP